MSAVGTEVAGEGDVGFLGWLARTVGLHRTQLPPPPIGPLHWPTWQDNIFVLLTMLTQWACRNTQSLSQYYPEITHAAGQPQETRLRKLDCITTDRSKVRGPEKQDWSDWVTSISVFFGHLFITAWNPSFDLLKFIELINGSNIKKTHMSFISFRSQHLYHIPRERTDHFTWKLSLFYKVISPGYIKVQLRCSSQAVAVHRDRNINHLLPRKHCNGCSQTLQMRGFSKSFH